MGQRSGDSRDEGSGEWWGGGTGGWSRQRVGRNGEM